MEMVPRKRGRPRKNKGIEIVADVDKTISSIDPKAMKELAAKLHSLELERNDLRKELETRDQEKEGIAPSQLQQKYVGDVNTIKSVENRILQCQKELSGQREIMEGGNLVPGKLTLENRYDKLLDPAEIKRNLVKAKYDLARIKPPEVSSVQKNRLLRRKKELEVLLKQRRSSIGDQWDTRDTYKFRRTVNALSKYNQECKKYEIELRNIRVILEPDNPMARDLSYLSSYRERRDI